MQRLPAANPRVGGGLNWNGNDGLLVPTYDQCGTLVIACQLLDLINVGACIVIDSLVTFLLSVMPSLEVGSTLVGTAVRSTLMWYLSQGVSMGMLVLRL